MRFLVVAATSMELVPFVAGLRSGSNDGSRLASYARSGHEIDVLTTGVGMVATAAWCSRTLGAGRYDLALNIGVCGTFDRTIALGSPVHVVTERIPELGAEDRDVFLTLQDLKLMDENEFPFRAGRLVNAEPPANPGLDKLRRVDGITVSTAHGNAESIAEILGRCAPQVESMEGAAFMYACLIHRLPFAQVRGVSNVVEPRNRAAWKLPEAIQAVGEAALAIVDQA